MSISKVDFNSLERDMKLTIFSHLALGERLKVASVSPLFRDLAYDLVLVKKEYRENIDRTDANGSIEKVQKILREGMFLGITIPKITYENIKELKDKAENIKKDSIIMILGKTKNQLPGLSYPSFSELKKKKYDEVIQEFDNWIEINKDSITSLDLNNLGLNCSGLGLSYLPESLGKLNNLKRLDLRGNQLRTLPDSIGKLSNLENLNLYENQLRTLPDSIGKLNSLDFLELGSNKLRTLPDSLGNLSNLITLDLDNNQLSTLPDSLGNLSSLKNLFLRRNQLRILPDSLGKLNNLQRLEYGGNPLRTIPQSIQALNLEEIY